MNAEPLTVATLIERLRTMPPDAAIYIRCETDMSGSLQGGWPTVVVLEDDGEVAIEALG